MSDYQTDLSTARGIHQVAHKNAASETDHIAADVAFYTKAMSLGHTYGVKNGAYEWLVQHGHAVQEPGGTV